MHNRCDQICQKYVGLKHKFVMVTRSFALKNKDRILGISLELSGWHLCRGKVVTVVSTYVRLDISNTEY